MTTEVIELRDISIGKAKEEIVAFLKTSGETPFYVVSHRLRLPFQVMIDAVSELEDEGIIKYDRRKAGATTNL